MLSETITAQNVQSLHSMIFFFYLWSYGIFRGPDDVGIFIFIFFYFILFFLFVVNSVIH